METVVVIKGHLSGHSYWIDGRCVAKSDTNGHLFPNYSDQPYILIMWLDFWSETSFEACRPLMNVFQERSDTKLNFEEFGQLDFVLDSNYNEVEELDETVMTIYSDGKAPRHYKEGNGTIIGYIAVQRASGAKLVIRFSGKNLVPKRIPTLLGGKFELLLDGEKYAEVRTSKLTGNGKLTIMDDMPVELCVPFAALARRLVHIDGKRH